MASRKRQKFKLVEIDAFDARQGYKRSTLPGVGAIMADGPRALADFWRDRNGQLVMRFSSQGYVFHFAASLPSGKVIPDTALGTFGDYISDLLLEWLIEGIDDVPESIYDE